MRGREAVASCRPPSACRLELSRVYGLSRGVAHEKSEGADSFGVSDEQRLWLSMATNALLPDDFDLGIVKVGSPDPFPDVGQMLAASSDELLEACMRSLVANRPSVWKTATPELPVLTVLVANPKLAPGVVPDGYIHGAWLVVGEVVSGKWSKPLTEESARAGALWRQFVGTVAPIKGNWRRITTGQEE